MKFGILDKTSHFELAYPELGELFRAVGPVKFLPQKEVPIPEAITRIVIGQMLSRRAASAIYSRVKKESERLGLSGAWKLDKHVLEAHGLSTKKAKCITEFSAKYQSDPLSIEAWRHLSYEQLVVEISKMWGLSNWSADMLAIFYFGHLDVFPKTDGTIRKGIEILQSSYLEGKEFDPTKAVPFRTYLSLTIWHAIDCGILYSRKE